MALDLRYRSAPILRVHVGYGLSERPPITGQIFDAVPSLAKGSATSTRHALEVHVRIG